MKKTLAKLTVSRETIRQLTETQLGNANGGFTGPSAFASDCCTVKPSSLCSAIVAQSDVSCAPSCADHGCA